MYKTLKNGSNSRKLPYLGMQVIRRLDSSLTALERIIFLRLLLRYGSARILKKDLKTVAEQIDIRLPIFKKAVAVLLEKAMLYEVENGQIRISIRLLKLGLTATKRQIFHAKYARSSPEDVLPRADFLVQLFRLLFRIRISHKQKNANQLLMLNYQQWLVLLNMVWRSDRHGVIFEASTHELANHTGLSRDALLRAITGLFEFGILRSKLNGSLNNNLLKSVSAIYFLNLSHPIWQEARIYTDFYLLKLPSTYSRISNQAFNFIEKFVVNRPFRSHQQAALIKKYPIYEFQRENTSDSYTLIKSPLAGWINYYYQAMYKCKPEIADDLRWIQDNFKEPKFKSNNLTDNPDEPKESKFKLMNSLTDNLERMNFLFHSCFIKSKFSLYNQVIFEITPTIWEAPLHFNQYLKPIQIHCSSKLSYLEDQQEALTNLRNNLLFVITQAIFRSEIKLIMPYIPSSYQNSALNILLLPQNTQQEYQIYCIPNSRLNSDSYTVIHSVGDDQPYHFQSLKKDFNLEEQKQYGLLGAKFKSFELKNE
ncbi:hypothetical protein [Acinetobacter sp. MB5]|uniref:hypothetical protein n=1 Tax=Acinetobacter sp. MB5 TaxID=2069438 RepID=UPI000DCF6F03|nr:hypothetical protein [Acinetobacter sp. MB5]